MAIESNTSKENVLLEDSYVGQTMSEGHVRSMDTENVSRVTVMANIWNKKNLHCRGTAMSNTLINSI